MKANHRAVSKSKPSAARAKPTERTAKSSTKKAADQLEARARAEYEALKSVMVLTHRKELEQEDQYWEAVGKIVSKTLYVYDGYERAGDWLKDNVDGTVRNSNRNIRVAALSSPAEQALYGYTKIDLAISLRDAEILQAARKKDPSVKLAPDTRPIDLKALRYTIKRDGKSSKLTLETITTDELRTLLSTYAAPERKPKKTLGPVGQKLTELFAAHPTLKTVTVKQHDAMLSLSAFRSDQCDEVSKVLSEASRSANTEVSTDTRAPEANKARKKPKKK